MDGALVKLARGAIFRFFVLDDTFSFFSLFFGRRIRSLVHSTGVVHTTLEPTASSPWICAIEIASLYP